MRINPGACECASEGSSWLRWQDEKLKRAVQRGFWSSGSTEWRTLKNLSEMPEGDDPASLQDLKWLARWLWVSFCFCNLVLIGCKSDSQQWTWQQWQWREGGCQGFLRVHEKKALESSGPMGSAVSDLPGCLKPTQVNIRKGELPVLPSHRRLCLLALLAPVRVQGRRGAALLPLADPAWLLCWSWSFVLLL